MKRLFLMSLAGGALALVPAVAARAEATLPAADDAQIYQLYAAYALALDTGNGSGVAATFAPDGTLASHAGVETIAQLRRRVDSYPHKAMPDAGRMHFIMGIHLTPAAYGADGTAYELMPHAIPGGYAFETGFYVDRLVKTPDGWRFKSRAVRRSGEDYSLPGDRKGSAHDK